MATDKNMNYEKAERLWDAVLQIPTRKNLILVSIDILDHEAIYHLKTDLVYEHVAFRFRKAGGKYVSARRIWYTDKIRVVVSRFYPPVKQFTAEDLDDLAVAIASSHK